MYVSTEQNYKLCFAIGGRDRDFRAPRAEEHEELGLDLPRLPLRSLHLEQRRHPGHAGAHLQETAGSGKFGDTHKNGVSSPFTTDLDQGFVYKMKFSQLNDSFQHEKDVELFRGGGKVKPGRKRSDHTSRGGRGGLVVGRGTAAHGST